MPYKTGKKFTLSVSGSITGICNYGTYDYFGQTTYINGSSSFDINILGFGFSCTPFISNTDIEFQVRATYSVNGTVFISDWGQVYIPPQAPPWAASTQLAGTFSASIDVIEVFDVIFNDTLPSPPPYIIYGEGAQFPDYGGPSIPDPPGESFISYYLMSDPAGHASGSVSAYGATATIAPFALSSYNLGRQDIYLGVSTSSFCSGAGLPLGLSPVGSSVSTSVSASGSSAGALNFDIPTCQQSDLHGFTTAFSSSVNVPPSNVPGQPIGWTVTSSLYTYADKVADVFMEVYSVNADIGENITWWQSEAGGAIQQSSSSNNSFTVTQQNYNVQGSWSNDYSNTSGNYPACSANTFNPIRYWLDTTWLSSVCEDPNDWRFMIRGLNFPAFTMTPASSRIVGQVSSLTGWTSTSNVQLSLGSGYIEGVVGKSGTASITYTPPQPDNWSAFRHLQISIRSNVNANAPFTLAVGGNITASGNPKTWQAQTGAINTFTTVDIDLCNPTSAASTTDAQDSKWPLTATAQVTDGDYWGVSNLSSIIFEGLSNNETYYIQSMTLIRENGCTTTWMPEFSLAAWQLEQEGQTQPNMMQRFVIAETDGRQSLEMPDAYWYTPPSGTTTYQFYTIQNIFDSLNITPDWSATSITVDIDGFHGPEGMATWLMGQGLGYWGGTWQSGVDVNSAGGLSVTAQALWDMVDWYPGCGDVFHLGNTGPAAGTLQVAVGKILHGDSYGLVLGGTGATVELDLTQANSCNLPTMRGSGLTGTYNMYITGQPKGVGPDSHNITLDKGSPPVPSTVVIPTMIYNRKRTRGCFNVPALSSLYVSLFRDYTDQLMLATVGSHNSIILLKYPLLHEHTGTPMNIVVDNTGVCSDPSFFLYGRKLMGTYLRDTVAPATTAILASSVDHGKTWTNITLGGKYQVLSSTSHRGRLLVIGYANAGDVGSSAGWYLSVGKNNGDGTFSWSSPTYVNVGSDTFPSNKQIPTGDIQVLDNGIVEFTILYASGDILVYQGRNIALDGSGTWTNLIHWTLPNTYPYTAVTSTRIAGKFLVAAYYAGTNNTPPGAWYLYSIPLDLQSGIPTLTPGASYPPAQIPLPNPSSGGKMRTRLDSVIDFAFIDTGGNIIVKQGRNIGLNSIGTWS